MQALTSVPHHVMLELERRPRSARRAGWTPPPQRGTTPTRTPVSEVDEASLAFKKLEIERRPKMAKRLGYVQVTVNGADLEDAVRAHDDLDLVNSSFFREEIERRPQAARRLGLTKPAGAKLNVQDLKLLDSAVYADEARRMPRAARRSGLLETSAEPLDLPAALPLADTAAGAVERARRPACTARLYGRPVAPIRTAALSPAPALRETAVHDLEVARRPRAAARHRAWAAHPELAAGETPEYLGGALTAEVDARRLAMSAERAVRSLAEDPLDAAEVKAEAARRAGETAAAGVPSPFAALERALEERLAAGGEGRVRGSGAAALAGAHGGPLNGGDASSRGGSLHNGRAGSRGGSTHGPSSRGGSLRGGRNIWGSATNLQAQAQWWNQELANDSPASVSAKVQEKRQQQQQQQSAAAVACELVKGNVVCRTVEDGAVVMQCGAEAGGDITVCFSAAASGTGEEACVPVD